MAGAGFALRRSRAVIGAWLAAVALCGLIGAVSNASFMPTSAMAPGSESERWYELTDAADFGANINVLLSGPQSELRRQSVALAERLREAPGVRVVSPYDSVNRGGRVGSLQLLRGDSALLLVDVPSNAKQEPAATIAPVRAAIRDTVRPPIESRFTGMAPVSEAIIDEANASTHQAELLAVPLLIIVLLLIFRSPVAAAIPLIMGLGTTVAAGGLVKAIATQLSVDQVAVTVTSMMALALGVDYSLLLVSRYREHRRKDPRAVEANIAIASAAANRTIAFAAVLLISVICAGAVVGVGSTIVSAALGLGAATIFGALSAIFVAPAVVKELDPWLDRWQLRWRRDGRESRLARRQPVAIPVLALVALLALAAPTLGLETSTPDVRLLPEKADARADYEAIQKTLGPGFGGAFNVAVHSSDGEPLTTKRSLAAITQLQRAIASDPEVESVFGPAELNRASKGVPAMQRALTGQGLGRLDRGLTRAAAGARDAGEGARRLHSATGEVETGSANLATGLASAERGSANVAQGVDDASDGSSRLAHGTERASRGAGELSAQIADAGTTSGTFSHQAEVLRNDLETGRDQLRALTAPIGSVDDSLARALRALNAMTTGRSDPRFQDALEAARAARQTLTGADAGSGEQLDPAYAGVASGIADAEGQFALGLYLSDRLGVQGRRTERGVRRLSKGASKLDTGLERLSASNQRLSDGLQRLATSGVQLPAGLERLVAGAQRLTAGVAQVDAGAGRLSAGIGGPGAEPGLTGGIERMAEGVAGQRRNGQSQRLERESPGLFESGLLPLALVDGTQPAARERTRFVLDLSNGGRTAQVTAFPTFAAGDPRVGALRERIGAAAERIERPGLEVAIGGPAAMLDDYANVATARLPLMILVFTLVSLLILTVAVRAIPLALLCVALNLLSVGVTFGVMQLGFGSENPLLGGPGYVDVISLGLTMGVVFALSIDYQVFLLGRIREEYRTSGDNERALTAAIGATASVITGAAVVMVAVFLAFCLSTYIGIRQMGVGLAIAVFLDATVVRLVLLPAAMRLAGDRIWWFPGWLDRRLPNVSL